MDITRAFFDILWQDQEERKHILALAAISNDVYDLEDRLKETFDYDEEWNYMHNRVKPYEDNQQYLLSLFLGHVVGAIRYDELAKLVWDRR